MIERGLCILRCFCPGEQDLPLSEIARRADMPKTTAHRIIAELVRGGMLERGEKGVRLGIGLFMLAARGAPHQFTLRNVAVPHAEHLHRALRASIFVFVAGVAGSGATLVHAVWHGHSAEEAHVSDRVATKVLQAFESKDDVVGLIPHQRASHTARVRNQGFAVLRGGNTVGIAAPVLATANSPLGALAVAGPVEDLDVHFAAEQLRIACAVASRVLAHSPEPVTVSQRTGGLSPGGR
ncbi:IclR family transcriptional regulator [Streptomyces sp. NPDC057433]|uniref:IclR family transcriptional regulator n=1 Tax=Streptomyces sp. NPDC057433 TaxID=3346132 RepID=UPI0036A729B8